ncbi:hypothetical protein ES332_A13G256200v1 [Gossypium tomentosum]|uniref:Reverse transcriptase zinc-binding domain-containing protein n=1 Tax=Gossypium tomentosum TaxID=34277 RepID=A0A5D2MQN1_GOSTO|nr:hypothetical protein ES332_A13G256200v1 [Gossypium tomentosum]
MDREKEMCKDLVDKVIGTVLISEIEDRLCWSNDKLGMFSRVDGFVEYFSLCYNVKLDESKKRLWLISIAAACWTIWIARNGLVFDGRRVNMANLVFQSKMRALLWIRSNHNEIMLQEKFWWLTPQRCCVVSHKSNAVVSFWRLPPCGWLKFNVCGIAKEDKARGGGILRDMEGIAREIFSGAVGTNVAEEVEIGAVNSSVVFSWCINKELKLWTLHVTFSDIETSKCKIRSIVFSLANRNGNDTAFSLALAGVNRPHVFKAWW